MPDIPVTIKGNMAADPTYFPGEDGKKPSALVNVFPDKTKWEREQEEEMTDEEKKANSVAVTVKVFGALADHVKNSLSRGMHVVASGQLKLRKLEVELDGQDRTITAVQINANALAPNLTYQEAEVTKVSGKSKHTPQDLDADDGTSSKPTSKSAAKSNAKTKSAAKTSAKSKATVPADSGDDDEW